MENGKNIYLFITHRRPVKLIYSNCLLLYSYSKIFIPGNSNSGKEHLHFNILFFPCNFNEIAKKIFTL